MFEKMIEAWQGLNSLFYREGLGKWIAEALGRNVNVAFLRSAVTQILQSPWAHVGPKGTVERVSVAGRGKAGGTSGCKAFFLALRSAKNRENILIEILASRLFPKAVELGASLILTAGGKEAQAKLLSIYGEELGKALWQLAKSHARIARLLLEEREGKRKKQNVDMSRAVELIEALGGNEREE